jgi:LAO/AO transport system kinase
LDAVGFDVIIVETVGVGQSEVDVVNAVDTVVLVLAPGAGDGVQAAKAGILEIADIYVVNKADRDGAEGVVRELRSMIGLGSNGQAYWTPEIVTTTATTGQGLADLVLAISKHHDWAVASGDRALRSVERAKLNLRRAVLDSITELMDVNPAAFNSLSAQVASGEISTESAVKEILQDLSNS